MNDQQNAVDIADCVQAFFGLENASFTDDYVRDDAGVIDFDELEVGSGRPLFANWTDKPPPRCLVVHPPKFINIASWPVFP